MFIDIQHTLPELTMILKGDFYGITNSDNLFTVVPYLLLGIGAHNKTYVGLSNGTQDIALKFTRRSTFSTCTRINSKFKKRTTIL
mgnify:FL=1